MGLTQRQSECLNFIRTHVRENGVAPTMDEITAVLGFVSKANAFRLVDALVERGLLRRRSKMRLADGSTFTRNRGLELVYSEYEHRPDALDCRCPRCPARRIQYEQMIQGLYCSAEISLGVIATNFRPLNSVERASLLGIPVSVAPRKRAAITTEAR